MARLSMSTALMSSRSDASNSPFSLSLSSVAVFFSDSCFEFPFLFGCCFDLVLLLVRGIIAPCVEFLVRSLLLFSGTCDSLLKACEQLDGLSHRITFGCRRTLEDRKNSETPAVLH